MKKRPKDSATRSSPMDRRQFLAASVFVPAQRWPSHGRALPSHATRQKTPRIRSHRPRIHHPSLRTEAALAPTNLALKSW
jgi:hypothetical protein